MRERWYREYFTRMATYGGGALVIVTGLGYYNALISFFENNRALSAMVVVADAVFFALRRLTDYSETDNYRRDVLKDDDSD